MDLAVEYFKNGVSVKVISATLCIALSTLYYWKMLFEANGGVLPPPKKRGRKSGEGRILNEDEGAQVTNLITGTQPTEFDLNYSAWTRRAVGELTFNTFGKKLAERTVGDYLKRWGFTPQKALRKAHQQNPELVAEWLGTTFPDIDRRCRAEGGVMFFGDEVGIHSESLNARSYAPRGKTPVIVTTGTRMKLNAIVGVSNDGLVRFQTYSTSMNCKLFIRFLKQLIKGSKGQKIFLVVDNLRVHHGKIVSQWLAEHKPEIEVFFLPPYSPELNPEEYFNNLLKQRLRAEAQAKDMEEFVSKVGSALRSLQLSPQKIRNIFLNENVSYASGSQKA
jgi:transposase